MQHSVKTFGCKVNTYDSALIQKALGEPGMLSQNAPPLHVVNTCAVTAEAVKSALTHIRQYRKKHPHTRIVVTGCSAQTETEKFFSLKEVDLVVANSHKGELAHILKNKCDEWGQALPYAENPVNKTPKTFKANVFKKNSFNQASQGIFLEQGRTRLFLKIQDGCNSFCTFCIIPFARGKSISLSPVDLIKSVQDHYKQGVREVVLTGVHIGDYRDPNDSQTGLAGLLRSLLEQTKVPRIRLSSLEPPELSLELLDLFSDKRICPHFHLSIQSANSLVLRKMKRQYTAQDVENTLLRINKKVPKAFVGMDLIAGFADESQQEFEDTYCRLRALPWTKIHVFPYSPREGTFSNRAYTAWPRSQIMKRAGLMRHLSAERFKQALRSQKGSIKQVLPLKYKEQVGLSRDYWKVKLPFAPLSSGEREVEVFIHSLEEQEGCLIGDVRSGDGV